MQRDLEERNRVIQTLKNDLNVVQKENQELTRQVYIFSIRTICDNFRAQTIEN